MWQSVNTQFSAIPTAVGGEFPFENFQQCCNEQNEGKT
jgi:hypothetical protein